MSFKTQTGKLTVKLRLFKQMNVRFEFIYTVSKAIRQELRVTQYKVKYKDIYLSKDFDKILKTNMFSLIILKYKDDKPKVIPFIQIQ